jgi:glutathione S-transferase
MLFDNHKFTSYMATYRFLRAFAGQGDGPVAAFFEARVKGAYGIVDKHMTGRDWVASDAPTIADPSMMGYLFYPADETGLDLPVAFPALARWRDRVAALPGWKHPHELMPGHPLTR